MILKIKNSSLIAGIIFLAYSNIASAVIESFSRAHCALPQDIILNPGKLRNECITWDPDEFRARVLSPFSHIYVYYGLKTQCDVFRTTNNTKARPTRFDIELKGIHSAVSTADDRVSQALWRAEGNHFRRPPNSSPVIRYTFIKKSSATNCNLHPKQFLGSIGWS
ncbi:hypothetical protein [Methyloglobulus sp.]|uniref:hypothetical protein n=1 Tax=Methyloglobulus sp. TaxID=2518622 RepID=UPI0032B84204